MHRELHGLQPGPSDLEPVLSPAGRSRAFFVLTSLRIRPASPTLPLNSHRVKIWMRVGMVSSWGHTQDSQLCWSGSCFGAPWLDQTTVTSLLGWASVAGGSRTQRVHFLQENKSSSAVRCGGARLQSWHLEAEAGASLGYKDLVSHLSKAHPTSTEHKFSSNL
jgi:hypothetical protein